MELQLIERTRTGKSNVPARVSVTKKGNIYVNRPAMEALGATKKIHIEFYQDTHDRQAWYIHVTENGYVALSPKSKVDSGGAICVADISRKIIESFYHIGKASLRFNLMPAVQHEGKSYFPIKLIKESLEMEIPDPNGRP